MQSMLPVLVGRRRLQPGTLLARLAGLDPATPDASQVSLGSDSCCVLSYVWVGCTLAVLHQACLLQLNSCYVA
jgi:hypothetical protein